MFDFLQISTKQTRSGMEIFPKFKIYPKSKDLMIRGGDFYAIWIEERRIWSTDEYDALSLIDRYLDKYYEENKDRFPCQVKILHMWDSDTGMIDKWHKYCQKQARDSYMMLDEKLVFSNTKPSKDDYSTKSLSYPLEQGNIDSWNRLISTLYSEDERHKIEWCIGSIVSGDSKSLQKFAVLYGSAGTGKSTILNIIQKLFDGYYSVFDAKALGMSSNSFALEAFKGNPLVAIQHDGDLSRIEDNTRLNSLVSHELMTVNEKFKSAYSNRFKCFLFMGTNKPVKITDGKSGIIRRLIDIHPSGNKLPPTEYRQIMSQIDFELGAIAHHCLRVYLDDPGYYNDYIPKNMIGATNDFYNFIIDHYSVFKKENGVSLKQAWEMYKLYCEDAKVPYPYSKKNFKEELKNYFWDYEDGFMNNGSKIKDWYSGFRTDLFEEAEVKPKPKEPSKKKSSISLEYKESILDREYANCPAQYASRDETPCYKWDSVKTKLSDLDTSKIHFVKIPDNHIVIDFDCRDENGNKSLEKCLEAAEVFPKTYAEISKGGNGIHLHYIYDGDVSKLSSVYDDYIEIKKFTGKSSLRRKLTLCNNLPIAKISYGLPMKGDDKVIDINIALNERALRTIMKRNLEKEYHPGTKPSIDFIFKVLEDAYNDGVKYDVSDMKNQIYAFAANSTNQADYCLKLVQKMKFKSEEPSDPVEDDTPIVFFDIEVFPNLFIVNWKIEGDGKPIVRMINPKPSDIEELLKFRLVGFNCRRFDNHILYAALMGYTILELYHLTQKIISGERNCFFSEAYNLSYTDIYDFASAGNKKSLKKLEIEMGIHHMELGLPWDQPVPEELWDKVAEYCDNDVMATESAFRYLSADWTARQILADLAGMTVNDTTNTLTTRIIFGNNRKPQNEFNYRNLAEPVHDLDEDTYQFLSDICPSMMSQTHGEAGSMLPYFPGYKYENGKSTYREEEVGEGGYVYAEPGMYGDTALLDVVSMHPRSALAEVLFGLRYTKSFKDIVYGRVSIKHEAWEEVNKMLDGRLTKHIQRVLDGELSSKDLANGLKTAINSVYGLTSANFDNPFRDVRNKDNIVAKRGALFMIDLKYEVQKRGFTVAHIKTDSIKIPDATPEIIKFVMEFGAKYGYEFEHEATYDRMCLVNDAVYIAKYKDAEECEKMYGYIPGDNKKKGNEWTATGKQFAVPYVFKKLFSGEEIEFEDVCETFAVSKGDLYLDINESLPDVTSYEKELEKAEKNKNKGLISEDQLEDIRKELNEKISDGHNYHFVGRVGQFTPVIEGSSGGVLYRIHDGKNYAAAGSKGYRWLESEVVKDSGIKDNVDYGYYNALVGDAIETISKYGDFEWFISEDPYKPKISTDFLKIDDDVKDDVIPFY